MSVIDCNSAARILRALAPEATWLLKHIESEDGYCRFPKQFVDAVRNLNIGNYPDLYEDESRIAGMLMRAFLEPEEMVDLSTELAAMTPEEVGKYVEDALQELDAAGDSLQFPKTPAEVKAAQRAFDAMSEEDKAQAVMFWRRFLMGFLAAFHQVLSIMVHGEKLTALVARAKSGDDDAFAKAVQIDKQILTALPYFKDRLSAAAMGGDRLFTERIAEHMHRPPYKGRVRHKSLYLAFAFLDGAGLLDTLKHRELLDLIEECGMGGHRNRIEDVKNLSKRLADYRAFQRRGMDLSTP